MHPGDPQSTHTLRMLKNNVQDMITQLNDSIWALNKKEVRLTAISDRFKVFVQKLEHAYPAIDISYDEEIALDRVLSPFQALHLFRMMQEALNNALRHSRSSIIHIMMFSNDELMQASISDNGIGMDASGTEGNGIHNLKTRAKESGWHAEWINNKDRGTSVIITTAPHANTTNWA
jgi:signal transduction histidine kinase